MVDAASTTLAAGLTFSMFCRTVKMSSKSALSILLITTTSATLKVTSPG
jgi:hypothetical protein